MPRPIGRRRFPAQDVEIAVICADFVKAFLRAVPLIQYFLDHVLVPVQPKANRPFVCRPTRVAIHFQLHLFHSDAQALRPPPARLHTSCPEKSMQSLDTIHQYLRLCGAPHNCIYVAMSVMLSSFMAHLPFSSLCVSIAT